MVGPQLRLPPLSASQPVRYRRSRSNEYNNSSPEWYWKLSPILTQLWIRDASLITPSIISELEASWLKYQTLGIPGNGDGATRMAKTKAGRRKLEQEYKKLDPEIRRAKEVALARHENFALRGQDGSLDYHTEKVSKENGQKGGSKGKSSFGDRACGLLLKILGG